MSMDVERIDEKTSDEMLVQMVRRKEDEEGARASLKELARRRSPLRMEIYNEVLADPRQSRRAKRDVINELGTAVMPVSQEMLLEELERGERSVIASIARSLGKIGDERALERLEAVQLPDDDEAAKNVRFARSLISYRLRLGRALIEAPPERRYMKVSEGISFEASKAKANTLRRANQDVSRDLPAITLAQSGAALLQCRKNELLLVLNEDFRLVKGLRTLGERNALPLVMLKSGLSLDRYLLDAYFFTQPSKEKGEIDLLGARPRGELIYAGKVRESEDGYAFSLRSLDTRYAPAIEVEGVYDPGKRTWEFSKAMTSEVVAARVNPAVTPQKVRLEI